MAKCPPPEELAAIDYTLPAASWQTAAPRFAPGNFSYPAKPEVVKALGLPNPREWSPLDADWKLPPDWKRRVTETFRDKLSKYRSLKVFMDICVRCGACADKCHFFIGGGDPKNMPVLRAELLRSVYRGDFTLSGKLLGRLVGARELTEDVLKEWFLYFYQCTECRRCSLFCPYGIDTAEITMMARELLNSVGCNTNWVLEPAANCQRVGNHVGIQPQAFQEMVECLTDDIEDITGKRIRPSINKKGCEVLFIAPSGDLFAEPGIYTFMGYLLLFEQIGLDYTLSTYASEGGNFGFFSSDALMQKLNAKMYAEAKRLGVKWILGGECGHMWRVVNQYMLTANGPADFLEPPVSPVTGTRFEAAAGARMLHICEFTADLIRHGKLRLDPSRNDNVVATFHDSCNPARGMGLLEEPREILKNVCRRFYEMPPNTIREQTFCCGGGAGLNNEEFTEMRLRGGLPRGNAVRYVRDRHGVNTLACICAIDRVTLPQLCDYWAPGVGVAGLHELVGNALVLTGESERTVDLRQNPLPGQEPQED